MGEETAVSPSRADCSCSAVLGKHLAEQQEAA